MFGKVNEYVQLRMYIWLNRRSQRGYELKYAKTYYCELKHMGLISLTCPMRGVSLYSTPQWWGLGGGVVRRRGF